MRKLKYLWAEKISLWIAWRLPPRVVRWCFIRVFSLSGNGPGNEYKEAYDLCTEVWKIKP